jgi:hypothetical protein
MDQEFLKVFFYDVRCAVVMHCKLCLYYSTLACYKQFETNTIIVLMFVESQTVHI